MLNPKKTLAILASTAAIGGGSLALAAPASAAEPELATPGTIAQIVSGVPGYTDVAEELASLLHVDTNAVLNATEEVLKDHSVDNVLKLLDTLGVHGL